MVDLRHERYLGARAAIASGLVVACTAFGAHAETPSLPVLLPPELDYTAFCPAESPRPELPDVDWATWSIADGTASPDDALRAARDLLSDVEGGGDDAVARRILEELAEVGSDVRGAALFELARLDLAAADGDPAVVVDRLRQALSTGYGRAAVLLGKVHLEGLLGQPVDVEQAKFFFRLAVVQSELEVGALAMARITAEEEGPEAARLWLALAQQFIMMRLTAGDCGQLRRMADLYLDDEVGASDPEAAIPWLEAAHAAGDTGALLRLARLLLQGGPIEADPERGLAIISEASQAGDPHATLILGRWYRGDYGGEPDPVRARTLFEEAAERVDAPVAAHVELARAYRDGLGGPVDIELAASWFAKAAAAGSLSALRDLGSMNLDSGIAQQISLGREQLRDAAERGDLTAAAHLGRWLLRQAGDPAEVDVALDWLHRASEGGDLGATRTLARYFDSMGNVELGLRYWQAMAEASNVEALVVLAKAVREGRADAAGLGTVDDLLARALLASETDPGGLVIIGEAIRDGSVADPNPAQAFAMFKRAADAYIPAGLREVGLALTHGVGVAGNPTAGRELLERASELGDTVASVSLARGLIQGWFGTPDRDAARAVLEVAFSSGSPGAARELGNLYGVGLFGRVEPEQALNWWDRAASAGDVEAMLALSNAAAIGFGMQVDLEQSTAWLQKAAQLGSADAMRRLAYAYLVGMGVDVDADMAAHWLAMGGLSDQVAALLPETSAQ